MTTELKPCPFCGGKADPEGWMSLDCKGPACDDCGASANSADAWNTRAVPDMPELDRYNRASYRMVKSKEGEYVRYDQAAAMIAAEQEINAGLRATALRWNEDYKAECKVTTDLTAELAQINDQGPVAARYRFITTAPPQREWSDWFIVDDGQSVPKRELDQQEVQPLYAAPVAGDAETIKRLREALEWYEENARLCRLIHSGGDVGRNALDKDGGKKARAALSGKEPS